MIIRYPKYFLDILFDYFNHYFQIHDEELGDQGDNNNGIEVQESDAEGVSDNEFDDVDYFRTLNLKKLITSAPEGNNIFTQYEECQKLNSTNQQSVVDIICRFLYRWLEKK